MDDLKFMTWNTASMHWQQAIKNPATFNLLVIKCISRDQQEWKSTQWMCSDCGSYTFQYFSITFVEKFYLSFLLSSTERLCNVLIIECIQLTWEDCNCSVTPDSGGLGPPLLIYVYHIDPMWVQVYFSKYDMTAYKRKHTSKYSFIIIR